MAQIPPSGFCSLAMVFQRVNNKISQNAHKVTLLYILIVPSEVVKKSLTDGTTFKKLGKEANPNRDFELKSGESHLLSGIEKIWCSIFLTCVFFFFIPRLLISLYSSHQKRLDTIQFIPNQPQKQRTFHSHHSSSKCSSVQVSTSNLYIQHCLPLISALELIHYFS